MPRISGTSEEGAPRNLSMSAAGPGRLRVDVSHPADQSGATIDVDRTAFMIALGLPGRTLPGLDGHETKRLLIERRLVDGRERQYVWLQGSGKNGWSILCDPAELAEHVPGERYRPQ